MHAHIVTPRDDHCRRIQSLLSLSAAVSLMLRPSFDHGVSFAFSGTGLGTVVFALSRSGEDLQPRVALCAPARPRKHSQHGDFRADADGRSVPCVATHRNSGVSGRNNSRICSRNEGVHQFVLSRFPFLCVFSWHSFGLNSCALRTAALCFALLSFAFVPVARPTGFGTPGKICNFRNSSLRNLVT